MNSRNAAFELFERMRHSTLEEKQLYKEMLNKYSIPLGERSIFEMADIEIDYCDICHQKTQIQRKYYHYDINCECCGGKHFEIIRYCKNCTPQPPKRISVILRPIEE